MEPTSDLLKDHTDHYGTQCSNRKNDYQLQLIRNWQIRFLRY